MRPTIRRCPPCTRTQITTVALRVRRGRVAFAQPAVGRMRWIFAGGAGDSVKVRSGTGGGVGGCQHPTCTAADLASVDVTGSRGRMAAAQTEHTRNGDGAGVVPVGVTAGSLMVSSLITPHAHFKRCARRRCLIYRILITRTTRRFFPAQEIWRGTAYFAAVSRMSRSVDKQHIAHAGRSSHLAG
jgi:hypothetical protein